MDTCLYFGTEEQKTIYVSKRATDEYLCAVALTETNAGSDEVSFE